MSNLFNPFHYLASLLVGLLPAGSSDLLVGSAALLGIVLALLMITLPVCAVAAFIEKRF